MNNFFALSGAMDILVDVAKKHDPEALERAATMLDASPSAMSRATAYLGWLLARVPEVERDRDMERNASDVLAELNALTAVLIDLESDASNLAAQQSQPAGGTHHG